MWSQPADIASEIADYDRQIQQKRSLLQAKEETRKQIEQENLEAEASLRDSERKLHPLNAEFQDLKARTEKAKMLLDAADANPEVVDITKVETQRKEYHSLRMRLNRQEAELATLIKQIESAQERLNGLRERNHATEREVTATNLDIWRLVVTKPVIVEGAGECLMHEEITPRACKEMALLQAKQDAIEKGGVSLVQSLREVHLFDLIRDEIRVETLVTVRHVDILQPPSYVAEGALGKYSTRIRAVVQSQAQSSSESVTVTDKDRQLAEQVLSPVLSYEASLQEFKQGDVDAALKGFSEFLAKYPTSELAPNAQYWLGECYYKSNEFRRAIDAFDRVRLDYPASSKAPAALFRKGLAYLALKDREQASSALRQVVDAYPKSPEANKALDKLMELKQVR